MAVALLGIVIPVTEVQESNASEMYLTVAGIAMAPPVPLYLMRTPSPTITYSLVCAVRHAVPKNALAPMLVTLLGIVTLAREVHLLNA